jgi:hypothetical protein
MLILGLLFGISLFPSQLESGVLPIMPLVVSFSWSLTMLASRGGNETNTHKYEFECHSLPYFSPNSDTNSNIFGYKYKMDSRIRILIRIFTQLNSNIIP